MPTVRTFRPGSAEPGGGRRRQYLFSDGNGVGSWGPLATGSWYAALYNNHDSPLLGYNTDLNITGRPFENYAHSVISSTYQGLGGVEKSTGSITLPATGKYRLSLSIYWVADDSNNRTAPYQTQAILRRKGKDDTTFADHATFSFRAGRPGYGVLPTFINILEFQAADASLPPGTGGGATRASGTIPPPLSDTKVSAYPAGRFLSGGLIR